MYLYEQIFLMLIGELSKRSGFTKDAIRFYEKQGFITLGWRERRLNNYKEYSEEVLRKLLLLKKVKSYDFTLHEATGIIALLSANLAKCDIVEKVASDKIEVIDQKIQELTSLKELLRSSIDKCRNGNFNIRLTDSCQLFDLD